MLNTKMKIEANEKTKHKIRKTILHEQFRFDLLVEHCLQIPISISLILFLLLSTHFFCQNSIKNCINARQ